MYNIIDINTAIILFAGYKACGMEIYSLWNLSCCFTIRTVLRRISAVIFYNSLKPTVSRGFNNPTYMCSYFHMSCLQHFSVDLCTQWNVVNGGIISVSITTWFLFFFFSILSRCASIQLNLISISVFSLPLSQRVTDTQHTTFNSHTCTHMHTHVYGSNDGNWSRVKQTDDGNVNNVILKDFTQYDFHLNFYNFLVAIMHTDTHTRSYTYAPTHYYW